MEAGKFQFAQLFYGGTIFEVPYYQRSYVWLDDQWDRFLSDMEYITSTDKNYFLGSVILKEEPTGAASYKRQLIIDGQQRFTTLALFFKSLCLKIDESDTFTHHFTAKDTKTKARLWAILHSFNDRADFEAIMSLKEDKPFEAEKASNIIKAYNYFQANIDKDKLDLDTLLNRITLICISLQQDEDEQAIFDTINSLGVTLTTGELLKNYFFTESTREEYFQLWAPTFEKDRDTMNYWDAPVVSGRLKRANIDFFFSAFLYIKIQDPSIKVSAEHKMRYRRSEGLFDNYKSLISAYNLDKKDMIYEILDYAELYHDNINPDIAAGEIPGSACIERMNFLIFVLDYGTLVPYTLYLLKNVKDEKERNAMFGYIESYVMRRQICKSDNKNFSDLFAENLINNQILSLEALKDYIENKDDAQALALPRDKKLKSAFHTNQLPNKKALSILYLLETTIREGKPFATKLYTFDKYSLEHLMPKQWEANWPLPEGVDANQRNMALLTLGNLSLLPEKLNKQISNAGWPDKKAGKGKNRGLEYYASDVVTLKDVLSKDVWDEKHISDRADWLAARAIEIWPSYLPEDYDEEKLDVEGNGADSLVNVTPGADTHDYTKFALNGGAFVPKSRFVLEVVRAYMSKHPAASYAQLKKVFHDGLCSSGFKFKGFLCTEEDYNAWGSKYKAKRYMPDGPDRRLTSSDGIVFFVNTQWTLEGTKGVAKLAKSEGFKVATETPVTQPGLFD